MKYLVFIALAFAATHSFAGDRVSDLKAQNPSASPYQILKQLFSESKDLIDLSDLDSAGLKCTCAGKKDSVPTSIQLIHAKSSKTISPATAAQGPLFPARAAQVETKEFAAFSWSETSETTDDGSYDYISVDNTPIELGVRLSGMPVEQNTVNNQPLNYLVRKDGTLLSFEIRFQADTKTEDDFYGYCWTN